MDKFEFDSAFGDVVICGIDEAGRGAIAGPVVAAAIVLKQNAKNLIHDVDDSKKFSEKKREEIYARVVKAALCYEVCFVDSFEIDEINILNATMIAMKKALEKIKLKIDLVLIDGNKIPKTNLKTKAIVKGDLKSASIAAASIVAKVERDRFMRKLNETFPKYCFAKHKGYGTREHFEKIKKFGICSIHRKTFLKKILTKKTKTLRAAYGVLGEKIAFEWLKKNCFNVILKNYHTRFGEIDLIAIKEQFIHFIEVKFRKQKRFGEPRDAVDFFKQKKIARSAVQFLNSHQINKIVKFSVIEVFQLNEEKFKINFIDDAFLIENSMDLFKNC